MELAIEAMNYIKVGSISYLCLYLNFAYLQCQELRVEKLERGIDWLDTGMHLSLFEASQFIGTLEARQGFKLLAWRRLPERIYR